MVTKKLKLNSVEKTASFWMRVIVAVGFLGAGVFCVYYAANHHAISVLVEEEREVYPPIPEIDPEELMMMSPEEEYAFLNPDPVIEKVLVTQMFLEPSILKDATIGGVERLASGEIKRTYSEGGDIPELCPT
jgi:hypothetical protein